MELLQDFSYLPFYILATATVISSLVMIFNPNLIRAGFMLIASFCSIAGLYFILAANFVAVSQVLIYAVGIVLVIIFAVMLCSLNETAADVINDENLDVSEINKRKFTGLVVCTGTFLLLSYVIKSQDWSTISHISGADRLLPAIDTMSRQYTTQIGNLMLSDYLLAFELISVLLLIVLVGVIILSKKEIETKEGAA